MEFQTTNGFTVYCDDEDRELVERYRWFAGCKGKYAYGERWINGTRERVTLHRLLVGAKPGEEVDHKDLNGLNNHRKNLRLCTQLQNSGNRLKPRTRQPSSRFRGVKWNKRNGVWMAQLCQKHLGSFAVEEDAAEAYDRAAAERYGEFARPNIATQPLLCGGGAVL